MTTISSFDKITFEFQTGSIPPPFCHRYQIEISKENPENLQVDMSLEYFDRDELTEDEIFEEGFSMDDDFSWKGSLPTVWAKEIEKRLKTTNWKKKPVPRNDDSDFNIKLQSALVTEIIFPDISRKWEILAQEIIQAVFELGKKEAPLQIKFISQTKDVPPQNVDFTFYFADQSIELTPATSDRKSIDWAMGQKLLKYIFNFDYYPENGHEKVPKTQGNYISPGDGLWYDLTPLSNASKKTGEQLERLVETLKEYC